MESYGFDYCFIHEIVFFLILEVIETLQSRVQVIKEKIVECLNMHWFHSPLELVLIPLPRFTGIDIYNV